MLKRLKYIFMTLLLATALQAAGQSYVIDSVCVGTTRHYRIDGEKLSTYLWMLYDQAGNTVTLTNATGTPFAETSPEKYGSELEIIWNQPGIFRLEAIQYSEFGCDTLQQGSVKVFDHPLVFPGPPISMCSGSNVLLSDATASNYSLLEWTTSGDGTFSSATSLNPVYTFGANDILAGTVALTLKAEGLGDSGTCTDAVGTVTITISNIKLTVTQTDLLCFESADGTIKIEVTGATGPPAYVWTGPNGFTGNQAEMTGLMAGTYSLTVTDQIGCTASATITLNQPAPITIAEVHQDSKCSGKKPGWIDITVSGGTPGAGYQYLWTGTDGFTATTEDIGDLAGTVSYTITVTDANGCTASSNIFINEEKNITLAETHENIKCFGRADGSIDLSVSGGKKPYDYAWINLNDLGTVIATTEDVGNLVAGTYRVTVFDANGCDETLEITLTEMEQFTALATGTDVKCFGGNDGTASVVVSGGTGTIVYAWTGPGSFTSNQPNLTGLIAGTYSVTVVDANGCTNSASVTINEPPLQNLVITDPEAVCQPSTVDLTAASVTAGSDAGLIYTYWTDAGGTVTLTTPNAVSASGTYYIKATNPVGCPLIKPVNVTINSLPNLVITDPEAVCEPGPVDLAAASVTAGSDAGLTLTYWTDAGGTASLTNYTAVSASGTYYIKATTDKGCSVIKPVKVTINPLPILVITDPLPVCEPSTIDLTAASVTAGSDAGLTFTYWTDAGGTATLTNPASVASGGAYYIKATNAEGCSVIKPVNVTIRLLPILIITDPEAVCEPSTVDLTAASVTAGSDPGLTFTYWTDAGGTTTLTNASSVASGGDYYIKASTSGNCSVIKPVKVTINPLPNLVITDPLPVCEPATIDLTASSVTAGSDAGLTFTYWIDSGETATLTNPASVSVSGAYYIKATNGAGCSIIKLVNVTVHPLPNLVITDPEEVCEPSTVDLTASSVTAGSGLGLTLTYWMDFGETTALTNPASVALSGVYYIKASAATGCSVIKPVKVTINPLPNLVITDPLPVCEPSTIDLTAASVTAGSDAGLTFTYWTDAGGTTTLTNYISVSVSGTYYIKATTDKGCSVIKPVKVIVNPLPVLVITDPLPVCEPGSVDLAAPAVTAGSDTGLTLTYWTDAGGTASLTNYTSVSVSGTYYIKATNGLGCSVIKPVKVTISPLPNLVITDPPEVCFPSTVDLTDASITAGSDAGLSFTYWTDAGGTATLTNYTAVSASGTYYIKATSVAGCSVVKPVKVTINPLPNLVITDPAAVCFPSTIDLTDASITAGSDAGLSFTYWTDAAGTSTLTSYTAVSVSGTYYIKATTTKGCSVIKPVKVTINPLPVLVITDPEPVCEPGTVDLTQASVTAGSDAGITLTYWTDAGGTATLSNPGSVSVSGTYYIKATNVFGCSVIKPVKVTISPLPNLVVTDPAAVCEPETVDLTAASVTAGSDASLTLTYWTNAGGTTTLTNPESVSASGTYYIKASTAAGCSVIKPVKVTINPLPNLVITDPAPVCEPATIDLTLAAVTTGSDAGLTLTYWTDAAGTVTLTTLASVSASGTYYIKATNILGCSVIKPVKVMIIPLPKLVITDPAAVCVPATVDLNAASVTAGSDAGLTFSYWTDAGGTVTLTNPESVSVSGTYYIKAVTIAGCPVIKPVKVTINPLPKLVITNPAPVCEPSTVNLRDASVTTGSDPGLTFTYWTDATASTTLNSPGTVSASATYYIKATNANGCSVIQLVDVTINPLPKLVVTDPDPVCEPQTVNLAAASVTAGSDPGLLLTYWTDAGGTTTLTNQTSVTLSGTYYIKASNAFGCSVIRPVKVSIGPLPNLEVNNPAAVCEPATINIAAPAITAGSDAGLILSYWTDVTGTTPLTNYTAISESGSYYIRATTAAGCSLMKPVKVTINPLPRLVITDPEAVCEPSGVDLTQASVTAGSGLGLTLTYWTNAAGTVALTNYTSVSVSGTYYIKATNTPGCSVIMPVNVVLHKQPLAFAGNPATICPGNTYTLAGATAENYSAVLWTTAGDGTFDDASLLHPTYTPGPNDLLAGGAALKLTAQGLSNSSSCIPAVSTFDLSIIKLEATVTGQDITCYNADDGIITISDPAGGSGSYEYNIGGVNWTATPSFTNLSPGTYKVQMRDALLPACFAVVGTITIIEPEPLSATVEHTDATCLGNDGSITVKFPTGGSGSYEYSLNGADWTSGSFTKLVPGTYTVHIRDANAPDCQAIAGTVIIRMPEPLTATVTPTNVSCFGGNDGKISISDPKNGSGAYEYSINNGGNWNASLIFNNLIAGIYTVQMRDFNAPTCLETIATITIEQPGPLDATLVPTHVTCYGSDDGTITVQNQTGGSGNYEYTIDGATWTGTTMFTNLKPDTYTVQIRDSNVPTCLKTLGSIVITEPLPITAVVTSVDITCYGANDGVITVSDPKNGTPGYEYTINGSTWTPTGTFAGLGPNTYIVRIRDSKGCTLELDTVKITEPEPLIADVASTNETCVGNDGTITLSNPENSRSDLYEYTIDGLNWTPDSIFTGLASNTYTVQIRDAKLITCARTIKTVTITEAEPLLATVVKTNVTCFGGNDGKLSISNPQGGSGIYEYSVDGSSWQVQPFFDGLTAASYTLLMRDAQAITCQFTVGTYIITQPDKLFANTTPTHVSCYGGHDGQIEMTNPDGGTGSYEYSVNGTDWFTNKIVDLFAGIYNVQIRDAAVVNCVVSLGPVEIKQPEKLFANVIPTPVTCFGGSDGIITVSDPINGVGPYQFSMDGGLTWQPEMIFTGLKANSYTLLVIQDANKCIATLDPVIVTQPNKIEARVVGTTETLPGANDGVITVSDQKGGSGSYEHSLDGVTWQVSPIFTGLAPGTYDVWVGDANVENCTIKLSVKIYPAGSITAEYDYQNVTCYGLSNGSITFKNPAGAASYEYSIGGAWQAGAVFTGLKAQAYLLSVRDANNHLNVTTLGSVEIKQPAELNATVMTTNETFPGAGNGSITVTNPSGGSGGYEYSIDGTTWGSNPVFAGLTSGTYIVQVRDTNEHGCSISISKVIQAAGTLSADVSFTNPLCFGYANGSITISNPSGGGATYEYSINGGATWQSEGNYTGLANGNYDVMLRDAATPTNRILLEKITIAAPAKLVIGYTDFEPPLCTGGTGRVTITARGGTPDYKGIGTFSMAAGEERIFKITDKNGCSTETPFKMPNPTKIVASAEMFPPLCFGEDGTVIVLATGGTGNYGKTVGTFKVKPGAKYSFIVRDSNGCQSNVVSGQMADAPPALVMSIAPVAPVCFGVNAKVTVTASGGTPDANGKYIGTGTFDRPAGSHTFTVTDSNGCSVSGTIDIELKDPLPAPTVIVSIQPNCLIPTGTIEVTEPKAGTGYTYSFDGGAYTSVTTFGKLLPGSSHTVRVKYILEGCESYPVTIAIDSVPQSPLAPTVAVKDPDCYIPFGKIDVTSPTGANYQYSFDGGTYTSATTFDHLLPESNHTISAIDILTGCISPETPIRIGPIPPLPLAPVVTVTIHPTCNDPNGTVVVTDPKEGTGFEYSIDSGPYQASATFTGLKWGNHFVTVRNIKTGCESFPATNITINAVPPAPVLAASSVNPLCYGDPGTISFSMTNTPDGVYVIKFAGGQFTNVTVTNGTATITAYAGTYSNMSIEVNGCTSEEDVDVIITQPSEIVITETVTEIDLKSQRKGAISIVVTGGTPFSGINPYIIKWSTGQTTSTIKDLDEGTFTVLVTDKNDCVQSKSIKIPAPNYPPEARDDEFIAGCAGAIGNLYSDNGKGIDFDPESDPFFVDVIPVESPKHGTVIINPDRMGDFIYTADPGYTGTDTLRYAIYDENHYHGDTASVIIHIYADFDGDGIADDTDPDADGDGILNTLEALSGHNWKTADTDGDRHPNWLDIDADNDGIVDNVEYQTTPGYIEPSGIDVDKNGIDDVYDTGQGGASIKPVDTDLTLADPDGIPDFLDADSDNDWVPDYIEGHDGSNADGKPNNILIGKDSDYDGLDDGYDTFVNACDIGNATGSNSPIQDFDGDGLNDWRDENDDDDEYLTRFEDLNMNNDYSDDDMDFDGHPEYLDYGRDCDLFIPDAFSPNGDNIHDYFQIYCINHFPNARMYIFDQLGNKLFEKNNYGNLDVWKNPEDAWWDGRTKHRSAGTTYGGKVPPGTYYYVLQLGNGEVKKSFVFVSY